MRTRYAERGTGNSNASARANDLAELFRVPTSDFRVSNHL